MAKLRMRSKFLLSMLAITAGLTATSLLLVRHSVEEEVRKEIAEDLQNSVTTFQNFQHERELTLSHSAELLADLPIVRALMTTQHEATIQDASAGVWKLAGSDLLVLTDRDRRVVALHTVSHGFTRDMAQQALAGPSDESGHWWFGGQHLYQVFTRPIYFGTVAPEHLLGFLIVGYELNSQVAGQVGRIAGGQVAFYCGDAIVQTTLPSLREAQSSWPRALAGPAGLPRQLQIGNEHFLVTATDLASAEGLPVRLLVLKSYDQATAFLKRLNSLLLALGFAAVSIGSGLVFLISDTFTRPLRNLVNGVRALGKGDFTYPLEARGGDEAAEVTAAFQRMRDNLLMAQRELLEAERLATIGRMASSISHDLRHSLAAIVANAEFLCESRLSGEQREELYQEVRLAVNQMTDLIDSLLEFSRSRESLHPLYGRMRDSLERVIQTVGRHPEFHSVEISVEQNGACEGWFDARRLERALLNLVLNACEAIKPAAGHIAVEMHEIPGGVEIRVRDDGRGIPPEIRERLFEPFVSFGKENGTGLGLTVVQKIAQDHGGDVTLENTSERGTVFRLWIPLPSSPDGQGEEKVPPLAQNHHADSI
ncbi:MAG TPA: ATP-binding protein [Terriglobales bacterium]